MPVGALVLADNAMEIDLWCIDGSRKKLKEVRILGRSNRYIYPNDRVRNEASSVTADFRGAFGRQSLMFGKMGQARLGKAKVAVIGLGGVGSLLGEYLARLGVGTLMFIDPDAIEASNLSRVVGARRSDLKGASGNPRSKVDIAAELASHAPSAPRVICLQRDVAEESVAMQIRDADFVFLAADSMRSRLVFNALVHQYHVPGVQLGSKIRVDSSTGALDQAFSVVRSVLPGDGCLLCNGLIDSAALAKEWHTDQEKRQADYGTAEPNPSVITLNAVAAAHGVNEFLFSYLGLRSSTPTPCYLRFDHLTGRTAYDEPRRSSDCSECSATDASRFGYGDAIRLPCVIG
jgi:molybdopterin/thiamine biosynthesis adenylyltransferase